MTQLPGPELGQAYKSLSLDAKATVLAELKTYLATIRQWTSPWGNEHICSITGGPIRSARVPNHTIGPCESTREFHDYSLAPARNTSASEAEFEETLQRARRLQLLQRPGVKFKHGDLKHHNILLGDKGRISGLLHWESAGWYLEFWEYTTAMRFVPKGFWLYDFLMGLGAERYPEELDCERALTNLTLILGLGDGVWPRRIGLRFNFHLDHRTKPFSKRILSCF
jgi:hypothetical protein